MARTVEPSMATTSPAVRAQPWPTTHGLQLRLHRLASGLSLLALVAATPLLIQNQVHIPHEEAQLQRAFGGWYSDHAASVRRWL